MTWWPIGGGWHAPSAPTPDELLRLRLFAVALEATRRVAPELERYVEGLRPLPADLQSFTLFPEQHGR